METELQFLIDLLLNHKLRPDTKKRVAERIGTVEANYAHKPSAPVAQIFRPSPTAQAPSTQAILDRDEVSSGTNVVPQVLPVAQRIVGGQVQTGENIKGKRKW